MTALPRRSEAQKEGYGRAVAPAIVETIAGGGKERDPVELSNAAKGPNNTRIDPKVMALSSIHKTPQGGPAS